MNLFEQLLRKIEKKKAKVGIVGMGYVGRALAEETIFAGFKTVGFVNRQEGADAINREKKKLLSATSDKSLLAKCDIILVCVQTPIHEDKTPDLRFLEKALLEVSSNLRIGQLIVIESSIAPGTTRNIALPILEGRDLRNRRHPEQSEGSRFFGLQLQNDRKGVSYESSKLKASIDFFLVFSPERVDPGNKQFKVRDIPKVVSGLDSNALELAIAFYSKIITKVVPVSTLETAELVKIFENTYRLVNISLVNELTDYANTIGVDMWEVIAAASTKPFGFMAHYPGPGVGGHCIPVDPYYLVEDARKRGVRLALVETAGEVNDRQPEKVVKCALEILRMTNGEKKEHKVLLIGITYKPDIDDTRESPALKIWELLEKHGISVSYHDPYVERLDGFTSKELSKAVLEEHDIVVITTNHSNIEYRLIVDHNKPVIDTRNVFKGYTSGHIYRV